MHSFFNRRFIYLILMLFVMIVIFILSHQSGQESLKVSERVAETLHIEAQSVEEKSSTKPLLAGLNLRKYAHIMLYAVLGITVYLFVNESNLKWFIKLGEALLICFVYSCTDELHQMFVPGRDALLRDVAIDAIGYGVAIVMCVCSGWIFTKLKCMQGK